MWGKYFGMAALCLAALLGGKTGQAEDFSGLYYGTYAASVYDGAKQAGGIRLGYNRQFSRLVVGAELDYFHDNATDFETFLTLRGGYAPSQRLLVFVTLGRGNYENMRAIWSVGLGGEYRLTPALSLRFDYEAHAPLGQPPAAGAGFAKLGLSWHF